jgi:RNA polymerase sigma factor (sigma-70 family)
MNTPDLTFQKSPTLIALERELLNKDFQRILYSQVFNIVKNHHDAEDIISDVSITAYKNLERFRGDCNIKTWLTTIALNKSKNLVARAYKKDQSVDDEDGPFCQDGSRELELANSECVIRNVSLLELGVSLGDALSTLSEEHRLVVELCDVRGLSSREVAQELGINEGTVRSRLHYAHRSLRSALVNEH